MSLTSSLREGEWVGRAKGEKVLFLCFAQDYTTDTYLIQKWTDPRLASEAWKVRDKSFPRKMYLIHFFPGASRPCWSKTSSSHLEARGVFPQCQRGRLSVRYDAQPAHQDSPWWGNSLHSQVYFLSHTFTELQVVVFWLQRGNIDFHPVICIRITPIHSIQSTEIYFLV